MKIALCMYGQPRLIHNPYTFSSHNDWIISKYNTDVYAHSWINDVPSKFSYPDWGIRMGLADVQSEDAESLILNNYKPKKHLFEIPKDFSLDDHTREKVKNIPYYSLNNEHNLMSHIYSMSKSIEIIDDISYYDWVIISRYDNYIELFPDLNLLDKNNLYLSDRYTHFCDVIIFGGHNYVKSLNCFNNFENLCEGIETFTAEEIKGKACRDNPSPEKRVQIEVGIVRTLTLDGLQK